MHINSLRSHKNYVKYVLYKYNFYIWGTSGQVNFWGHTACEVWFKPKWSTPKPILWTTTLQLCQTACLNVTVCGGRFWSEVKIFSLLVECFLNLPCGPQLLRWFPVVPNPWCSQPCVIPFLEYGLDQAFHLMIRLCNSGRMSLPKLD